MDSNASVSADGAFVLEAVDAVFPSQAPEPELQYRFRRRYDSHDSHRATALGHGWSMSYDEFITPPPGAPQAASPLWETNSYCQAALTAWATHRQTIRGLRWPNDCPANGDPVPSAPNGVATDRIDDVNGDVFMRRGTGALRFHRDGPEDANGVSRFKGYPDVGQVLEFRRAVQPDGNEVRLVVPATGVTRVYRPVFGPAYFVLPLPSHLAGENFGEYRAPERSATGPWWDSQFWHRGVAKGTALLGYYLAEIRNASGQRMSFDWEVIGVDPDFQGPNDRYYGHAKLDDELHRPGALLTSPQVNNDRTVVRHDLPSAMGRLRKVTDTTGREIHYHYRDTPGTDPNELRTFQGTAHPELWCVSLSSDRASCKPNGSVRSLVTFDFGYLDRQLDLLDVPYGRYGAEPFARAGRLMPARRSNLMLRSVLDAEGRTLHRYDYEVGVPGGLGIEFNAPLGSVERDLVCGQLCGEAPEADEIYGTPRAWSNTAISTDVCGLNAPANALPAPASAPFSRGVGGLAVTRADCEAILTDPVAATTFVKAYGGYAIYPDSNYDPRQYTLAQEQAYATQQAVRNVSYALCQNIVDSNPVCSVGGSSNQNDNGPIRACAVNLGQNWLGGRCETAAGAALASGRSNDRAVCRYQCEFAFRQNNTPVDNSHLYGSSRQVGYNLLRVYNSRGQLEVENTYRVHDENFRTAVRDVAFDRVVRQVFNQGPGLEPATVTMEYYDLDPERNGGMTGSPAPQVLGRSSWTPDRLYRCDAIDPDTHACLAWTDTGPDDSQLPPQLAMRTHTAHGNVTVSYLNERDEVLRQDTFADASAGAPYETIRNNYDSRGRLINALDAAGRRALRRYTSEVAGALLSETLLASNRAPYLAPVAGAATHTAYGYAADGRIQDSFSHDAAGQLIVWTHLVRDDKQRLIGSEVTYAADADAPVFGTSYSYESPDHFVAKREASWHRSSGDTHILAITVNDGVFDPFMAAYPMVSTYDAKGRVAGSDPTAVVTGADVLIGTEHLFFDGRRGLVIGSDAPDRTASGIDFNHARQPVATIRQVQTDPNVWSELSTTISYGTNVLPESMEELWTDPVTAAQQRRVTTLQYDALGQITASTVSDGSGEADSQTTCRHVAWDGRELDQVNAEGEWTTYEYDDAGRYVATQAGYKNPATLPPWALPCQTAIQQRAAEGKTQWEEVERIEYHPGGYVKARIVEGRRVSYTVDGFGRVVGESGGKLNREIRRGYDAQGRVVWEAAYRLGTWPSRSYERPVPTADYLLEFVETSYDAQGRVTETTVWDLDDQKKLTTRIEYQDALREVTTTAPNGLRTLVRTDAAGRQVVSSTNDSFGNNVAYSETNYDWATNSIQTIAGDNRNYGAGIETITYLDGNGQVQEVYDVNPVSNVQTRQLTQSNDLFGRAIRRTQRGLAEEKSVYDVFGRMVRQTQDVTVAAGSLDANCPVAGTCSSLSFGGHTFANRNVAPKSYAATDCRWVDQLVDWQWLCNTSAAQMSCNADRDREVAATQAGILAPYRALVTGTANLGAPPPESTTAVCSVSVRYPQPNTSLSVDQAVASQKRIDFAYDKVARTVAVTQYGGVDLNGNLLGASTTRYAYDALNRVVEVTEPSAAGELPRKSTTAYKSYRPAGIETPHATGLVAKHTSSAGTISEFFYDGNGRLGEEVFTPAAGADVQQVTTTRLWTYDDCPSYPAGSAGACGYGRIIRGTVSHRAVNGYSGAVPRSVTTDNRYDRRGRLVETWNDVSAVHVSHDHDAFDVWSSMRIDTKLLTHRFDGIRRLKAVDLTINGGAPVSIVAYDYDYGGTSSASGGTATTGPVVGATYGDGSRDTWLFDNLRRPTRLLVSSSQGSTLASRREAYGEHGIALMREHQFLAGGVLQTSTDAFRVDQAGRLITERTGISGVTLPATEIAAGSATIQQIGNLTTPGVTPQLGPNWRRYDLDGRGNWSARATQDASYRNFRVGVRSNDRNEYLSFDLRDLASPADNTLLDVGISDEGDSTFVPSYTAGAAAGAGVEFSYDLFDRPLALTSRTSATTATTVLATYDAFGRRILEETGSQRTHFLWSGEEIVAFGSSSTAAAPAANLYHLRVIGEELDSTIAVLVYGGGDPVYRLYYHQWADGSTLATTVQGALDAGVRYSAWGEIAQSTGASVGAGYRRWLWKGALYDAGTRTYSLRAREFSPQLGRFLSTDPVAQSGGLNLYAFGDGRSHVRDPSGLFATSVKPIPTRTFYPHLGGPPGIFPIVFSEPVHQLAIERQLGGQVTPYELRALQAAQVTADENQAADAQDLHAMLQYRGQSPAEAVSRWNDRVRQYLAEAVQAARNADQDGSLLARGFVIHTLQDGQSPEHGFQAYEGGGTIGEILSSPAKLRGTIGHGSGEYRYPTGKVKQALENATQYGQALFEAARGRCGPNVSACVATVEAFDSDGSATFDIDLDVDASYSVANARAPRRFENLYTPAKGQSTETNQPPAGAQGVGFGHLPPVLPFIPIITIGGEDPAAPRDRGY